MSPVSSGMKLYVVIIIAGSVFIACAARAGSTVQPDLSSSWKAEKMRAVNHVQPQEIRRQGGESYLDALMIVEVPFSDTGTTLGFVDDFAYSCPVTTPSSDVFYRYTPTTDIAIDVDLAGSNYDTVVFVFRRIGEDVEYVACNDDYYQNHTSYVSNVELVGGDTYYIIVDGYYDSGTYAITVEASMPCEIACNGIEEGEPPLANNYIDQYNGGCNSLEYETPFQELIGDQNGDITFCGVSGWYDGAGGHYRDTDWFVVEIGPGGAIEVMMQAEEDSYLFELWPHDCAYVSVQSTAASYHCAETQMTINGEPGDQVWLWVGPVDSFPPYSVPYMYVYVLNIAGLEQGAIAIEKETWGTIKSLYYNTER